MSRRHAPYHPDPEQQVQEKGSAPVSPLPFSRGDPGGPAERSHLQDGGRQLVRRTGGNTSGTGCRTRQRLVLAKYRLPWASTLTGGMRGGGDCGCIEWSLTTRERRTTWVLLTSRAVRAKTGPQGS